MSKPRLLDLFCGAGGAAMGYHRAGFEVVGVDIKPQRRYPFEYWQQDALDVLQVLAGGWQGYGALTFDAIHASPPCHDHSSISGEPDGTGHLLEDTIVLLKQTGLPWVCENVPGPKVRMDGWYFVLCGSMFEGLKIRRHRRFGASFLVIPPGCNHNGERPYTITGEGGACDTKHSRKPAAKDYWRYMEMPWMEGADPEGVAQAIPPAYTEHIGHYLMAEIKAKAKTAA